MAAIQMFPQLTEGGNFNNWYFRVKTLLEEKGVAYVLEEKAEEKENFVVNDAKARAVIVQCLSDKYLEVIKKARTANDMIKSLKDTLERKSVFNKLFLKRKLLSLKCVKKERLQDHFFKFDAIINEIEASGTQIDEIDKVCHLLLTLPDEYDTVITAIETLTTENDKLSMEFVKSRLLDAEIKIREKHCENNIESSFTGQHGASFPFTCYSCGKKGHKASDCRRRTEHNRGKFNYRMSTRGSRRGRGQANITYMEDSGREISFVAFKSEAIEDNQKEVIFVIDSGATENLVKENMERFMFDIKELENIVTIEIANGEVLKSRKRGKLRVLYKNIPITINALIVPNLSMNLMSVRKMLKNRNVEIIFSNKGVKISHEHVAIYGETKGNLYILRLKLNEENCMITNNNDDTWHKRLGHLNRKGLAILKLPITKDICDACMQGKATRLPFFSQKLPRTKQIGELLHTDIAGPIKTPTQQGEKYYQTIIDDYSHFCVVYLLKAKSEADKNLREYIMNMETQQNVKVKRIRCDNGGEFRTNELQNFCRNKGISIEYTQPYSPQQNGVSERMNRTLQDRTRTLMAETNLPKHLWGEAIRCATYQLNRCPTSTLFNDIPARRFYGKLDMSNLRVFGSKAWSVILPQKDKLNIRAKSMIMVGYAKNGYRLWCPETNNIEISRDVRFNEKDYRYQETEEHALEENKKLPVSISINENETEMTHNLQPESQDKNEVLEQNEPHMAELKNKENKTRSGRQINKPQTLSEYELYTAYCLCASNDPQTYDEAINSGEKWREAIDKELEAHKEMNTWTFTDRPEGKDVIDTKWIFRTKENGTKKARLVARGFKLQEENYLSNNYAPVARMITVRLLLAQAIKKSWQIKQLDIPTAFLNGKLDSEVYIDVPEGINYTGNKVLKLNRGLYGLRQSPKCWNMRFDTFMRENGFERSKHDFCLYRGYNGWLLIFVDDILITGEEKDVKTTIEKLKQEFKAKELGEIKNFLGMEFQRNENSLKIIQRKHIDKMLNKFKMSECNGTKTPIVKGFQVDLEEEIIDVPYRELIGSLMFLSMLSRPDINYATSYLSQFLDKPVSSAWIQAKRILRYLKETRDFALNYKSHENNFLESYSDADWGGDKLDRKSVSGCVTFYCGNAIAWFSRKQQCVALSTAEAEYVAAAMSASDLVNIQGLCSDFGEDIESVLYVDNKGAIDLCQSFENSKRAKHIDIKYHFIKDLVASERIKLKYVDSKSNKADLFTKGLSKDIFNDLRQGLNVY